MTLFFKKEKCLQLYIISDIIKDNMETLYIISGIIGLFLLFLFGNWLVVFNVREQTKRTWRDFEEQFLKKIFIFSIGAMKIGFGKFKIFSKEME